MNRMVWSLTLVLCSAAFLSAQKSSMSKEMNGTICNSKCVLQTPDYATCDPKCDITGGTDVFIDDAGRVNKIANQDMCTSHEGKHVTMTVVPAGTEEVQTYTIQELHEQPR